MDTIITVREGTNVQIPFQLIGDNAPIQLGGVNRVEIVLIPQNGEGTPILYDTTGDPSVLTIVSSTLGKVGFTPDGSTDLLAAESPYRVFFWVYTGATTRYAVPNEDKFYIEVTDDYE